jgi:hypothetical protein
VPRRAPLTPPAQRCAAGAADFASVPTLFRWCVAFFAYAAAPRHGPTGAARGLPARPRGVSLARCCPVRALTRGSRRCPLAHLRDVCVWCLSRVFLRVCADQLSHHDGRRIRTGEPVRGRWPGGQGRAGSHGLDRWRPLHCGPCQVLARPQGHGQDPAVHVARVRVRPRLRLAAIPPPLALSPPPSLLPTLALPSPRWGPPRHPALPRTLSVPQRTTPVCPGGALNSPPPPALSLLSSFAVATSP